MRRMTMWLSVMLSTMMFIAATIIPAPQEAEAAGEVIEAVNASRSAVLAAIALAENGDTVVVPATTQDAEWNEGIVITKAITLKGKSKPYHPQTVIKWDATAQPGYLITFTQGTTGSTRITGFTFKGGTPSNKFIKVNGTFSYSTGKPLRIDNNYFEMVSLPGQGANAIEAWDASWGLIDHNRFKAQGNAEVIKNWGDYNENYQADVFPGNDGNGHALYIEDNSFENTTAGNWGAQSAIQSYRGAVTVARHNDLFDNQIDQHGLGEPPGARWFEFYENTFHISENFTQDKYFDIRSGSGVIFNNHKVGGTTSAKIIFRSEVGFSYTVGEGQGRKHWSPAYTWNNVGNDGSMPVAIGQPQGDVQLVEGTHFIKALSNPVNSMKLWQNGNRTSAQTNYNYQPYLYPYPLFNELPNPGGVTPPLTSGQTMFTTQSPLLFGTNNINKEFGTKFQTTKAGKITKVRIYTHPLEEGIHKVRIWRESDGHLLSGPHEWNIPIGSDGWQEYDLPDLSIAANTTYIVAVSNGHHSFNNYYPYGTNGFPIGRLNLAAANGSGVYSTISGAMPTTSSIFYDYNYFRDVVFVPNP